MPVHAQFELYSRNWVGRTNVHSRKISHSYGSCCGTNMKMCRIMENVDSGNVKSKFHYVVICLEFAFLCADSLSC